jgi:murein L,D-transpeptidase YcbB/YkuD
MKRFVGIIAATILISGPSYGQAPLPKQTLVTSGPLGSAVGTGTKTTGQLPSSSEPTFDEGTDDRLKEAIKAYAGITASGGWPAIPKEAKFIVGIEGAHDNLLRQRLIISSDLNPSLTSGAFDAGVADAVKRFQRRHGLAETGNVGPRTLAALNVTVQQRSKQLEASLLRTAAIDFHFGARFVAVHIPAAFVEAVENDQVVHRYRVVVGKTEKPSPTVTSEITDINLNPNWTLPPSITKNEIAAHMRRDPTYLSRMHMQVYDDHNTVVDPSSVDWSVGKTPNAVVRQEPGPWNALGQLKINMPNSYAVYMHDTNQKGLLSEDYRFDSHGCARVENVRDLAAWLLQATPSWDRAKIDAAISTGERQTVKLARTIPVAWIYLTGWMTRDGVIHFRDDIYAQDEQLLDATTEVKAFFDEANGRNSSAGTN